MLPYSLQRRSVIVQAMAGAGKTAAFVLTALALLKPSERRMQALLLSETRELAMQTHSARRPSAIWGSPHAHAHVLPRHLHDQSDELHALSH